VARVGPQREGNKNKNKKKKQQRKFDSSAKMEQSIEYILG
jgi:hypothetical protein